MIIKYLVIHFLYFLVHYPTWDLQGRLIAGTHMTNISLLSLHGYLAYNKIFSVQYSHSTALTISLQTGQALSSW